MVGLNVLIMVFCLLLAAGVFINTKEVYRLPPHIPEGLSRVFLVHLHSTPKSTVNVTFNPLNETVTVDPRSMLFLPSEWNVSQELIVHAVEDNINMESSYKASVGININSSDRNYNRAAVDNLVVTVEDNDEGGGVDFYGVSFSFLIAFLCRSR